MAGLRKYPPVLDEQWFSDLVDFLGGITAESQLCTLKILLHGAEPSLLSSWQAASDKSKIDGSKVIGIPVGSISPLTGDLNFAQYKALNILIDVLASDPATPLAGQIWYRSDLEKLSIRRATVIDRFVTENLAQTLASKTLTTPAIGDFTNAGHNHQAAAGGAQLDHGLALTGLGDDDHTQYLNTARHDTVTRHPITVGGTGLSTIALGGILYTSALDTLIRIAPSAANQVLRSSAANALEIAALVAADVPNLDTAKIVTGILVAARGGLGKAADLTGLLNDYVLVYKSATDNWIVEAKPTGGGGGGAAGWENVICYPWAGTAVLSGDPVYTYTSEASDITGIYVEAFWFDFDFAAGNIKSIFANLVWAMKITGTGNGYAKWQAASGSHASPGVYYDFTDEHAETGTVYSDHSRSGVAHKITGFPTTTPFVIRLMIKKGTATSVEAEIKSNTYFRVTYKVT